jgi:2-keto-3-deoxy-L-rhamnonate aldolase RhmA
MIEDPEAVDDIERILGIPGLDAAFIGQGDLTQTTGDRETAQALTDTVRACISKSPPAQLRTATTSSACSRACRNRERQAHSLGAWTGQPVQDAIKATSVPGRYSEISGGRADAPPP